MPKRHQVRNEAHPKRVFILSIMLELETKQVDFTLAFCQAKLGPGNYIEMPRRFEHEGHVLELKRNLYGGRASGANFFNLLKEQLERRGFVASQTDPCLFINHETSSKNCAARTIPLWKNLFGSFILNTAVLSITTSSKVSSALYVNSSKFIYL